MTAVGSPVGSVCDLSVIKKGTSGHFFFFTSGSRARQGNGRLSKFFQLFLEAKNGSPDKETCQTAFLTAAAARDTPQKFDQK